WGRVPRNVGGQRAQLALREHINLGRQNLGHVQILFFDHCTGDTHKHALLTGKVEVLIVEDAVRRDQSLAQRSRDAVGAIFVEGFANRAQHKLAGIATTTRIALGFSHDIELALTYLGSKESGGFSYQHHVAVRLADTADHAELASLDLIPRHRLLLYLAGS